MKDFVFFILGCIVGATTGFLICIVLISSPVKSSDNLIFCQYNHGLRSYTTYSERDMAGIHREFKAGDLNYIVHIEDKNKFTEEADYITIENREGYRITYPLECE